MKDKIKNIITESIAVKERLREEAVDVIEQITKVIVSSLKDNGKVLVCGNGGSAADSQHIAAELVGRFKKNRPALKAVALTANTSSITAIGNDFGFEEIFVREVEALGDKGDVLIGISTSGNSANVIKALEFANKKGLVTIGFSGGDGGKLKDLASINFIAPSDDTPRIQEAHITAAHIVCELVEEQMCGEINEA